MDCMLYVPVVSVGVCGSRLAIRWLSDDLSPPTICQNSVKYKRGSLQISSFLGCVHVVVVSVNAFWCNHLAISLTALACIL